MKIKNDILLSKPNTNQTSDKKSFFGHDFSNLNKITINSTVLANSNLYLGGIDNKNSEIINDSKK